MSTQAAGGASLRERREAIVRRHVDAENNHELDAALATFHRPKYDVVPFGQISDGEAAVRELLGGLFQGFPDFRATVLKMHHADDAVICEVMMDGTQRGPWAGLAPTNRHMHVPTACIFEFEGERLVCEKVYFDSATLMRQLTGQ
jgi:steroid delta-isomerase-like uncharacterized protein